MSEGNLLNEIEEEALRGDVLTALRLCLRLGGKTKSEALREWAASELKGYGTQELPEYRRAGASLCVNAMNGNTHITGQQISKFELPKELWDRIPDEIQLRHPLTELIALGQSRDSVRLLPPGAAETIALWNSALDPFHRVTALYWSVSPSRLRSVADSVRTTIVELIAELRAGMGNVDSLPSPAETEQAVSVAIRGKGNRVVVNAASGNGATVLQEAPQADMPNDGPDHPWVRWSIAALTFLGTAFAGLQLVAGWPF